MKTFKTFLIEGNDNFAPWHLRTLEDVKKVIPRFLLTQLGLRINKNGTFTSTKDSLYISEYFIDSKGNMVVKLQNTKQCLIRSDAIRSIWGAPSKCTSLELRCQNLLTLEHLNSDISERLAIACPNLQKFDCNVKADRLVIYEMNISSLTKFNKYFDVHHSLSFVGQPMMDKIKSNLLSLLLMKNLQIVNIQINNLARPLPDQRSNPFTSAISIINKHLKGERDALECQEELISAGYKEFAKL